MFRTVKRWFSDSETRQLAQDCDRLADRVLDIGHKLEGLQLRIERHLNKLQMRDSRAARGGSRLSPEDAELLDELRSARGGDLPAPADWPHMQ